MNHTNIEYLINQDGSPGYVWNFYQGCRNQENGVCALPCWAKAMAHRFGRSFEPTLNEEILGTPGKAGNAPPCADTMWRSPLGDAAHAGSHKG